MTEWDVTVIGGGPAGSAAAAFTARAGLRTLLIDRAIFPREKVCGDCLNPGCWEVFDQLGVARNRRVAFCSFAVGRVQQYSRAPDRTPVPECRAARDRYQTECA